MSARRQRESRPHRSPRAEPLSQTAQAVFPPLIDAADTRGARRAARNLAAIAAVAAPCVAAACALALRFGAPLFTTDAAVIALVRRSAFPAVFVTTASLVLASTIDGARRVALSPRGPDGSGGYARRGARVAPPPSPYNGRSTSDRKPATRCE